MLSILETGNKHKANIFKDYKSEKWLDDTTSGYFYAHNLKGDFCNEAILSLDFDLLVFRQTLAEDKTLQHFSHLEHTCSSLAFLYIPDYIEIVPDVFKNSGVLDSRFRIIETATDFFSDRFVTRNAVAADTLPKGQTAEVSVVDLVIKLASKSAFEFPLRNALFVFKKEEGFHLLILQKEKLLFANTFDFTAYEEVLYFCLNALKDLGLEQESSSLFYSETDYSEHAVKLWSPYFAQAISFEKHLGLPSYQGEPAFDLTEFTLLFQLAKCV